MATIEEYPGPEIYTLKDVCDYLRIHRGTVYRLIRKGQLRTIHVGRVHRVTSLELERIMAEHGVYAKPQKGT